MKDEYKNFLTNKITLFKPSGFDISDDDINQYKLFDFQETIVKWSCKRGRAAVFADTGLGKTRIQLAWANEIKKRKEGNVIIFSPLCVANQTIKEGKEIGVNVEFIKDCNNLKENEIYITNYDSMHKFEQSIRNNKFCAIVLDESSIIKHESSKTRNKMLDMCINIKYKLSCTATPSPNDYMELGNQCEFLGVMNFNEMLSMFFIHDGSDTSKWRLKGHAKKVFWKWMSQWAICLKKPSDLGFKDDNYILPNLNIIEKIVDTGDFRIAQTLIERNNARRKTIKQRVKCCADIINSSNEQWLVWCHLNDESNELCNFINNSVQVSGSDDINIKEKKIMDFTDGNVKVLITKPSIAGFGMNWQHCHNMCFVGLSDSYEQLYQAVRRCYRFGQKSEVNVYLISADIEGKVLSNIKRKEKQNETMFKEMVNEMKDFSIDNVKQLNKEKIIYEENIIENNNYKLYLGDCVEVSKKLKNESIDYSIFSPPFSSLYTYSNNDRDMGNSKNDEEFFMHFSFLVDELYRILKSGRCISVHCMNLPLFKSKDGVIGIKDFRGDIIRLFQQHGFIYHSEVCIWKDPVVAMQRTKAIGLLWKQIKKDSSMSRQGLADYIVTFRKPGDNINPINHECNEFPVHEWQDIASPVWLDINQSNTLNKINSREDEDERHICPLQLDVIQRCLKLWSKKGDVVLSPFSGIGSEGYVSILMGRHFIGIELKKSYWELSDRNLRLAKYDENMNTIKKNIDIPKITNFYKNEVSLFE